MAVSTRTIKRRIKSVANTRKITKAMELVAASKMRKAAQLNQASRSYSSAIEELVSRIRRSVDPKAHPFLFATTPSVSSLLVIASSDRGLCGGFNAQLLKKSFTFLRERNAGTIRVVTVGRRAERAVRRAGYPILAAFDAISNAPSFDRTLPIGQLLSTQFGDGSVDRVYIAYTDFRSAVAQIPLVKQLLPVAPENELQLLENEENTMEKEKEDPEILFEPNPKYALTVLLPRLLETQVYQALLESAASEHAARMLAMRSATDNASSMLEDLTFTFNQARQAGITREISEISAGKAAIT